MRWVILLIVLVCISISFYFLFGQSTSYYWKDDWRLNDLRNSKFFTKQDLKVKCFFGFLYYTYKGTYYSIPVLDKKEKLVRCTY